MAGRTDSATRIIKASAAKLYQAMTTRQSLEQWLPPSGMSGEMVEFNPRPGGSYRMILRYDDATTTRGKSGSNQDVVEARFIEIVPNARIVQAVDFDSDDPRFAGTMTMSWILTPLDDETEVSIVAENVPEGITAEDHAEGMNASLENLARFVAA